MIDLLMKLKRSVQFCTDLFSLPSNFYFTETTSISKSRGVFAEIGPDALEP